MKAGLRLIETINTTHFERALAILPQYLTDTRAKAIELHQHTRSVILVSWPLHMPQGWFEGFHAQRAVVRPVAQHFPEIIKWVLDFARQHGSWVSRAQIVVLEPHKEVYLHEDWGLYYALRDRYHLVLRSAGSLMISGSEQKIFHTGDVFLYPNKVMHGAKNIGEHERIHLIFDVLPRKKMILVFRFLHYLFLLKRTQRSKEYPSATFAQDIGNLFEALRQRHFTFIP